MSFPIGRTLPYSTSCAFQQVNGPGREVLSRRVWLCRRRLGSQVVAGVGQVEAFVGQWEVGDDGVGHGDGQGGPVEPGRVDDPLATPFTVVAAAPIGAPVHARTSTLVRS